MMTLRTPILLAAACATALAQDQVVNPPTGWVPYGLPIQVDTSRFGFPNWAFEALNVSSQDQEMTTILNFYVFKNGVPTRDGKDYYLVTGTFRHKVNNARQNWVSIGWYGGEMKLQLDGRGARVVDYGPTSTVGNKTTGFSVGVGISAADQGASFGYSQTYESPEVIFSGSADSRVVDIRAKLPGGAKPPSFDGYKFQSAAVFQVERGAGITLSLTNSAEWRYEAPRLTVLYRTQAWASGIYDADFRNRSFRHNASGLCAGVRGGVAQATTPVELQVCDPNAIGQKWSYTDAGQIKSSLSTESNALCLDSSAAVEIGAGAVVNSCDVEKPSQKFQSAQLWKLSQATPYRVETGGVYGGCYITSPTSFVRAETSCVEYPAGSVRPASKLLNGQYGLVIGSGLSIAAGTQLTFQGRRGNATPTGGNVNDRVIVDNNFFTLQ